MCYLCLKENPFDIRDMSKNSLEIKKSRAKVVKEMLFLYRGTLCDSGQKEIDKLKEEQYQLSREI